MDRQKALQNIYIYNFYFRTSSGCMCFSSETQSTWSSYNLSGLAAAPPLATPSRSQIEE